jgi:hypothetical protein
VPAGPGNTPGIVRPIPPIAKTLRNRVKVKRASAYGPPETGTVAETYGATHSHSEQTRGTL